jgi:hypothetical protein
LRFFLEAYARIARCLALGFTLRRRGCGCSGGFRGGSSFRTGCRFSLFRGQLLGVGGFLGGLLRSAAFQPPPLLRLARGQPLGHDLLVERRLVLQLLQRLALRFGGASDAVLEAGILETHSGGFVELVGALDRTAVLPLGGDVAVDQLDDRDRRRVRCAKAGLDDPAIAAASVGVARRQRVEQLDELRIVEQPRMRQAGGSKARPSWRA